ncbi:MAG TPA: NAD(+)/NADH kinase [Thermoleophilaceae bacterium]
MSAAPRAITVFTHHNPAQTAPSLRLLLDLAREAGVEVRLPAAEVEKHALAPEAEGAVLGADPEGETDLAVVLGGDGTILSTLRLYTGRDVPVFAVNYGAIGFLSTVEHADLEEGLRHALAGEFDVLELPALAAATGAGEALAYNDISFHRRHNGRVAELAYSVAGEQLGEVRCDGLVVSTPAGSTGYNLANAGPVLAWGVEGYVVSFIAPHTLTARALVVAPDDELEVTNRSEDAPVDMTADGQAVAELGEQGAIRIRFVQGRALLAQAPGATFYHRLRDKFGRLAY